MIATDSHIYIVNYHWNVIMIILLLFKMFHLLPVKYNYLILVTTFVHAMFAVNCQSVRSFRLFV